MSNNIEGKFVRIAGASGGPGEASDRSVFHHLRVNYVR
jgi:hypothetical protein